MARTQPLELDSVERMPLRHLWKYHFRWWLYACSPELTKAEKLKAYSEAHRAAVAVVERTNLYL
jgi:hypothetical protein